MFLKSAAASALLLLASGVSTAAAVIDFETSFGSVLSDGDVITTVSTSDQSVVASMVIAKRNPGARDGIARIYDTRLGSPEDPDLNAPFFPKFGPRENQSNTAPLLAAPGNVLIVEEFFSDPLPDPLPAPDDNGRGGVLTFEFDTSVLFSGVTFIDDGTLDILGSLNGGDLFHIGTIDNGGSSRFDNVLQSALFAETRVDRLVFDFGSDSGGIDDVIVSAVPLPAGLMLLLTGLGGFALARRRKT